LNNATKTAVQGVGMTSHRSRQRLVKKLKSEGISNRLILDVISNTPRHLFVENVLSARAYDNTALPIGSGQTISQPLVVAMMTEMLIRKEGFPRKVLEIGTGCGYQTAILAQLADQVYTIERIRALAQPTMNRLYRLKYRNIQFHHGDGRLGWKEHGPYDGIIVTAGAAQVPDELVTQLATDGRLVMPVGPSGQQSLRLFVRHQEGLQSYSGCNVEFVPLLEGSE
jgi:protein-L-isoaspartate(D-aspartate) O-methyltransferase